MKHLNKSVLIIAVPRSGSTSLCNAFGKSFKEIQEPLNNTYTWRSPLDRKEFFEQISKKNIVIKTMPDHLPSDWKMGDYLNFNHVILLDRKDIKEQHTSWTRLLWYLKNDGRWPEWTEKKLNSADKFFYLQKYLIREIQARHNLKMYFYEDIFFNNYNSMFNELEIDIGLIDTKYLDPQYKYKENLLRIEFPKELI